MATCAETPEGGRNGDVRRSLNSGMGAFASQDCIPHQSEWTEWTVHSVYGLSLISYLRLIWVPHQNALAQNIKSASLGTPISVLAGACVVCDVVCMLRDVFPIQIRVSVFFMTRLCANAEIGVPRGRTACLRHHPSTERHSRTPRHHCTPRYSCSFSRHSCLSPVIPAKAGILTRA